MNAALMFHCQERYRANRLTPGSHGRIDLDQGRVPVAGPTRAVRSEPHRLRVMLHRSEIAKLTWMVMPRVTVRVTRRQAAAVARLRQVTRPGFASSGRAFARLAMVWRRGSPQTSV